MFQKRCNAGPVTLEPSPFTGLVYVSYLPSRVDNSRLGDVLEGVGKGPGVTAEPRVRLLPMKAGITAAGRTS